MEKMKEIKIEREARIEKIKDEIKKVDKEILGSSKENLNTDTFWKSLLAIVLFGILIFVQLYGFNEFYWKSTIFIGFAFTVIVLGNRHEKYMANRALLEKKLKMETTNPLHAVKDEENVPSEESSQENVRAING